MFEEIRVRGLGVIDEAEFTLAPGLTVVTGETGAGKTMVVTSLGLLLGGRADAALVRTGARQAVVEGRVRLPAGHGASVRALEAGADLDDGALLLARVVAADGRGRAHVGGRSVPVSVLAEMAEHLAAVHGQADQQRLSQPARQRAALDRYAGGLHDKALSEYRSAFERWQEVTLSLAALTAAAQDRAQRADLLRFGLDEIDRVRPLVGEDRSLSVEAQRLGSVDALRTAAETARLALTGDETSRHAGGQDGAGGLLGVARAALEAAARDDPVLARLAERVAGLGYETLDLANDLASYAADLDDDPLRLAAVQDRLAALSALTRKYGSSVDAVLEWERDAASQLGELEGDDQRREALTAQAAELTSELATLAGTVSTGRVRAAGLFGAAVSTELVALAMPGAEVSAAVRQEEAPARADGLDIEGRSLAFGPYGVDTVELLFRPHPGATPRPVHRGASGGELSRVMLAIEVVFAAADPVPTFVFDEVDAGVGGRAAVEVGARLARLARTSQVIVVTHLAQVAAFADRHLVVTKSSDGVVTTSDVIALDDAGREHELSRMLAGMAGSATGRAHAVELIEAAAARKAC